MEKVSLLNLLSNNRYYFDEEVGICRFGEIKKIYIITNDDRTISCQQAYDNKFSTLDFCSKTLSEIINFDNPVYILDPNSKQRNPYGGYPSINKDSALKINIKEFHIFVKRFKMNLPRQERYEDIELIIQSNKQLHDKLYFQCDNISWFSPIPHTIKLNDEYYYINYGRVKVTKIFDYPNESNDFIEVEDLHGNTYKFTDNYDTFLFYLPYQEFNPRAVLMFLDECKNEISLSPVLYRNNDSYILIWREIPDAANYVVSMYKLLAHKANPNVDTNYEIYHLSDFDVDRNTKYFKIDNLVGSDYIFRVRAENRNGEVIAQSRGTATGKPHNYGD